MPVGKQITHTKGRGVRFDVVAAAEGRKRLVPWQFLEKVCFTFDHFPWPGTPRNWDTGIERCSICSKVFEPYPLYLWECIWCEEWFLAESEADLYLRDRQSCRLCAGDYR